MLATPSRLAWATLAGCCVLVAAGGAARPAQAAECPSTIARVIKEPGDKGREKLNRELPQYIVGYGSLMSVDSRRLEAPTAVVAWPVRIFYFERRWAHRVPKSIVPGLTPTFLGAKKLEEPKLGRPEKRETWPYLNGVIYRVKTNELEATDKRETGYCRELLGEDDVDFYGLKEPNADGARQMWVYLTEDGNWTDATKEYPIVQSYVDVFLQGCLEFEDGGFAGFAKDCIKSTEGWNSSWVNDRPQPRRPAKYGPLARKIDELLFLFGDNKSEDPKLLQVKSLYEKVLPE